MKILIIRHGDPDYEHDTLTEKGWREAKLLSERISKMEITDFYVSPLGRAKDTASLTLEKMGRTATTCDWLREFHAPIRRPDVPDHDMICWDWLPQDWTSMSEFYDYNLWHTQEAMSKADVKTQFEWVTSSFDALLAKHGYVREGNVYMVEKPNNDTIAFFCHFGLECVLLSRLMNVSPMVLWHSTAAAPTSVTTIYTEERRKGIASFRVASFGDISHLYVANEEPSFSARFCELYDNKNERHD